MNEKFYRLQNLRVLKLELNETYSKLENLLFCCDHRIRDEFFNDKEFDELERIQTEILKKECLINQAIGKLEKEIIKK